MHQQLRLRRMTLDVYFTLWRAMLVFLFTAVVGVYQRIKFYFNWITVWVESHWVDPYLDHWIRRFAKYKYWLLLDKSFTNLIVMIIKLWSKIVTLQPLVQSLLHGGQLLSELDEEQRSAPSSLDAAARQTFAEKILEGDLVLNFRRHHRPDR